MKSHSSRNNRLRACWGALSGDEAQLLRRGNAVCCQSLLPGPVLGRKESLLALLPGKASRWFFTGKPLASALRSWINSCRVIGFNTVRSTISSIYTFDHGKTFNKDRSVLDWGPPQAAASQQMQQTDMGVSAHRLLPKDSLTNLLISFYSTCVPFHLLINISSDLVIPSEWVWVGTFVST